MKWQQLPNLLPSGKNVHVLFQLVMPSGLIGRYQCFGGTYIFEIGEVCSYL
jgi:hypothetical protein